jgi:lipopolysaccharide transport system permease protein
MSTTSPPQIKIYGPANQYSIRQILKEGLLGYKEGFYLARLFVLRDFKAKYKTSYIGYVWEVVPSITTAMVWIFLRGSGAVSLEETPIPFPAFVIIGTIMWSVITESISKPMEMFMKNSAIITKINIPKEGLLLMGFFNILINQAIKMILVVFVLFFFGLMPSLSLLYFIPLFLSTVVLFMSIGVLLMPLEYMLPDIARIKNYGLMVLLYLSPVVYMNPKEGLLATVMRWNPLSYVMDGMRNSLTGLPVDNGLFFAIYTAVAVGLFLLATILYRVMSPIIIQRISA